MKRAINHEPGPVAKILSKHFPSKTCAILEEYIFRYGKERAIRPKSSDVDVRPELDRMRKSLLGLAERVEGFGVRELSMIFRSTELHAELDRRAGARREALVRIPSAATFRVNIESVLVDLRNFADRLATAHERISPKRGPKDGPRQFVKTIAAAIEASTGTPIKLSKKSGSHAEILREIVQFVDPSIGQGTIDEAVKARARRRRGENDH